MPVPHNAAALEQGDPANDPRGFRRCLGQFATGVTVMTATVDGGQVGVTANSFSSLSLDPPLILWSIARSSRSFSAFEKADHFAVNILAAEQIDLSQRFASTSDDKFEGVLWEPGSCGSPLISGTTGILECRSEARHAGGDHLILIGRVVRFVRYPGEGLLFAQGRYAIAGTHPAVGAPPVKQADPADHEMTRMSALIFQAHRASWAAFDVYREEEDMTFPQGLVLFALWGCPPLSVAELANRILLPERGVADVCTDLMARKLVSRDVDGLLVLTEAGRCLRESIRRRAESFERQQLHDFPADQIATVRQFLTVYARRLLTSVSDVTRQPKLPDAGSVGESNDLT